MKKLILVITLLLFPILLFGELHTNKAEFRLDDPKEYQIVTFDSNGRLINVSDANLDSLDLRILTVDTCSVYDGLWIWDTDTSHYLHLKWNEAETVANRTLNFLVAGGDRTLTLNENFTIGDGYDIIITALDDTSTIYMNNANFEVESTNATQRFFKIMSDKAGDTELTFEENLTIGDGANITITAEDSASTFTMDEQNFEVEGQGNNMQLLKLINANDAAATLTIEGINSIVNQDLTTDADVVFDSLQVTKIKAGAGTDIVGFSTNTSLGTSNDSLSTTGAIKTYTDALVTAQDLDFAGDSGIGAIDLDSETFKIKGTANKIVTSATGDSVTLDITILKDLVTTAPITGGTNDILVGADADITIAITVEKDIVTAGTGMSGGADNVLTGADADVTITLTTNKDIVTTAPLTGGENDVLPGADADLTIAIPVATTSVDGYLSQTDWDTFNDKMDDIVEDTTPQLGGDLDANTFNILIDPADTLFFGTDTYFSEVSGDVLDVYVGGANIIKIIEVADDTVKITAQLNMDGAITGMQKIEVEENAGEVTIIDMPVNTTDGLVQSYTFGIDNDGILKVLAVADGSNGVDEHQVIIQGTNYNASHTQLTIRNTDEQATTETGQTVDLEFKLKGTIDSGSNFTDEEAGKISVYKTADYWHASDQTDNDAGLKLYTVTNGAYVLNTTLSEDDLATVGNISSATYGSDKSITDAELLTLDNGALTEILVGGGAGSAPVWTTATGTGAPVRAGSPTFTTKITTPEIENAGNILLDPAVDGASYVNIANSGTGSAKLYIEGDQIISDDLSDRATIGMLDEAELLTATWTPNTDQLTDWGSSAKKFNHVYGDSAHFNQYGGNSDFVIGSSGNDITFGADTLKGAPVWEGNIVLTGTVDGIDIATVVTANTEKNTNATHTGDVTGSGALTIADDSVGYAKIQNIVNNDRVLGRISGANGIIEELTATQVRTLISVESGATADQTEEEIQDSAFTNVFSGTETRISVTYEDATNDIDFVVDNMNLDIMDGGLSLSTAPTYLDFNGTEFVVTDATADSVNVTVGAIAITKITGLQTALDARCLESVFGTSVSTGLTLDGTALKTSTILQKYHAIDPSANVQTMLGSANNAAILSNIGAEPDLTDEASLYTTLSDVTNFIQEGENATLLDGTAWRVFYTDTNGDITELALGVDGSFFESNGAAAAPAFRSLVVGDIPDISGTTGAIGAGLVSIAGQTEADVSILEMTADDAYNVVTSGGNNYILGSNADNTALEFKTPANVLTQIGGAPIASPAFTTQISIGDAVINEAELEVIDDLSTSRTQLNYLSSSTGTSGTTNTNIVFSDAPTFTGLIKRSVTAGITAVNPGGQGDGALTTDINEVSTCGAGSDAVTLPTAVAGLEIFIINNGAQILEIWPANGDNLGAGVNTATTLAAGANVTFISYNSTNWEIK